MSTPRPKPKLSQSQSNSKQKTLLGFFQKKSGPAPSPAPQQASKDASSSIPTPTSSAEHAPSSSPVLASSPIKTGKNKENGLPSPVTPILQAEADGVGKEGLSHSTTSPSRKVCFRVNFRREAQADETSRPKRILVTPSPKTRTTNPSSLCRPTPQVVELQKGGK